MLLKPLISEASNEILKEAGLLSKKTAPADGNRLREILDSNGLSLEETITELSFLAKGSQDETIKLRSLDTALKLHGAMKEETAERTPQIIINITPLANTNNVRSIRDIPSILLPREVQEEVTI